MSCQECNDCQDGSLGRTGGSVVRIKGRGQAYYRWKNANIEMNGCDKHLREVFDALNEAQANGRKNQP